MSGQKIDLDELAFRAHRFDDSWLLALVAAVRAARAVADQYGLGEVDHRALKRLSAALAPFTDTAQEAVQPDSAEVRSDGN